MNRINRTLENVWLVGFCGALLFFGFVLGSAWPFSDPLEIMDEIGSFLGGIGTVAAVYYAVKTYNDWKKIPQHELAVQRCSELLDSFYITSNAFNEARMVTYRVGTAEEEYCCFFILKNIAPAFDPEYVNDFYSSSSEKIYKLSNVCDIEDVRERFEYLNASLEGVKTVIYDYLIKEFKASSTVFKARRRYFREIEEDFERYHNDALNKAPIEYYDAISNHLERAINDFFLYESSIRSLQKKIAK